MRTTSQSTCLHETLATVAIIKIDPLERLVICNATSKNHKAYFISLLQKDNNRNYSVINYRVPEKRQKLPGKEKYRGNRIWTCDLTAPSRARYQATPYPDETDLYMIETIICIIIGFVNNYLIFKIALKIDKIHSDKTLS